MIKNLTKCNIINIGIGVIVVLIALFLLVKYDFFIDNSKKINNLFFKNLNKNNLIEEIKKIQINYNKEELTLTFIDNKWTILEKNNFPALTSKVKDLIFGLVDLKIIEPKTSKPENFSSLQLEDFSTNNNVTKIALFDVNNQEIDSIYIGKRDFVATPNTDHFAHIFIRRPSEEQAWLVSGRLPESFSFKEFVAQPAVIIDSSTITEVTLVKPKHFQSPIKISRDLATGDLKLLDIPARHKLKDQYIIENIIQQFSYLNYDDVIKDSEDGLKVLAIQLVVTKLSDLTDTDKNNKLITLKYDFDLVYLKNNYYLRIKNPKPTDSWLYKINDYVCQSLLINKSDLLNFIQDKNNQ